MVMIAFMKAVAIRIRVIIRNRVPSALSCWVIRVISIIVNKRFSSVKVIRVIWVIWVIRVLYIIISVREKFIAFLPLTEAQVMEERVDRDATRKGREKNGGHCTY